jgi:hypothetical protein
VQHERALRLLGAMCPDFTRLEKNEPLGSAAFTALVESHGIGDQGRKLEVRPERSEMCLACPEYRTCSDLSLAKRLMKTLLANGWYGA